MLCSVYPDPQPDRIMDEFQHFQEQQIYDTDTYRNLPHVVKFSGGRSSAMLLKLFLDRGLLDAKRGDVIVFNNTSAEHPATYEFVRNCASYAESKFSIPFFWIEFATYEDVSIGDWSRLPTFRMVNHDPKTPQNPNGFHWRGEIFEELVSMSGFLPSRHTRTCTAQLKLETTSRFLAEWFAGKEETIYRGHFHAHPQVSDSVLIERHQSARGKLQPSELLRRRAFVRSRPFIRESQKFSDFTHTQLQHMENARIQNANCGEYVVTKGQGAIDFVSLIGLRYDEKRRVHKVLARNNEAKDGVSRTKTFMLEGEIVLAPLNKLKISKNDVQDYWDKQSWNLLLPDWANLSNCVYCFNKGTRELSQLGLRLQMVDESLPPHLRAVPNTPSDINWWVELEKKYVRVAQKNDRKANEHVRIGCWGVDSETSYESIKGTQPSDLIETKQMHDLPCDCTD